MKSLFEPLRFRNGATAPNRLVLAPLTNKQSHVDGTLSNEERHWLELRADGGFGTITTCATHVTKDGQGWEGEFGLFSDAQVPSLRGLAEGLHARHARGLVQIFHGGARADASVSGHQPISASDTEGKTPARAATRDDIERIIDAFASAARRAHEAGMDGVEIHGAHGYLLTQFLSATENRRDDAFGGSLENRARLVREVTRTVRSRVPANFVVGVRLSPEDFGNARGLDLDESIEVARWLADDGVDFVHLSLWRAQNRTTKRPDEHALSLFRAALPADLPLVVAGSIWTRAEAESMLALCADAIALGRAAIANPDWPLRAKESANWEPKRPPLTEDELRARGLSDRFVQYMRNWKGFVV